MPPEALEEARGWLIKASRDLQAADYLATAEVPLLDVIVYHCQQAILAKPFRRTFLAVSEPTSRSSPLFTSPTKPMNRFLKGSFSQLRI